MFLKGNHMSISSLVRRGLPALVALAAAAILSSPASASLNYVTTTLTNIPGDSPFTFAGCVTDSHFLAENECSGENQNGTFGSAALDTSDFIYWTFEIDGRSNYASPVLAVNELRNGGEFQTSAYPFQLDSAEFVNEDNSPGATGYNLHVYFDLNTFLLSSDQVQVLPPGGAPEPVPEPSTWATMLLGFAWVGYMGYRRAGQRFSLRPPQ
jgi:hypothetical protein